MTELEHMAQDPELSKPRKEASAWALAEIARLRAQIAAPGDGEIAALVALLRRPYGNLTGAERHSLADILTALVAERDAAVARAEKAEGAVKKTQRFFSVTMPKMNIGDSFLDAEDFGIWNEAAIATSAAFAALPDAKGEKPINWAKDPDAIVEDDEPQIGRDYA